MSTIDLAVRQRQPELMDQLGLDESAHREALAGIQRINELSRIGRVLWREIGRIITRHQLAKARILDVACGGGDLALCLARHALRRNLDFTIDGCDISHTAVTHARSQAIASGADNVRFYQCNALSESFDRSARGKYDILMCSLFLHHLDEEQAAQLLRKMAAAAGHAVIIDDLRRTRIGYGLAWIGCRLLTRSPMVHMDGPLSVEGAFTVDEAQSLAARAGLPNTRIVTHWPQRFLMTWQRAPSTTGEETAYDNE